MKIISVTNYEHAFFIECDNGMGMSQRTKAKTTAEDPLTWYEEIVCALCAKVVELEKTVEGLEDECRWCECPGDE